MVTKEAAMSFSQFGYPYNATSQVSTSFSSAFLISLYPHMTSFDAFALLSPQSFSLIRPINE